jgi:hypothetical protein
MLTLISAAIFGVLMLLFSGPDCAPGIFLGQLGSSIVFSMPL